MRKDMTAAQGRLADYMSDLSEEAYCAAWMDGLEFALWEALTGELQEYGRLPITQEHRDKLGELSNACGGWIVYDDRTGETWVSTDEWRTRFSAGRPPLASTVDDG